MADITTDTNGYQIYQNGYTLAFYAARYAPVVETGATPEYAGVILNNTTYDWGNFTGQLQPLLNAQNILRFTANNGISWWTEYTSTNIMEMHWNNVVTDALTHHYLFYIERTGGGFGDTLTIHLYVDGEYRGFNSHQTNIPPAFLNNPMGVGRVSTGPGTIQYAQPFNQPVSFGNFSSNAGTLADFGQLWFGHFNSQSQAIGNLWRNGWVDLGPYGTRGALETITPLVYNNFGYAQAGYLAYTGLASQFSITAQAERVKDVGRVNINSTAQLQARPQYLRQEDINIYSRATLNSRAGVRRGFSINISSASTLSAQDVRIRQVTAQIQAQTTLTAQGERRGEIGDITGRFSLVCQPQRTRDQSAQLSAQTLVTEFTTRLRDANAALSSSAQQITSITRRREGAVTINSTSSLVTRTSVRRTALANLITDANLVIITADYRLFSEFQLSAQAQILAGGQSHVRAMTDLQAQGNYNTTDSANLTAFASAMILADVQLPAEYLQVLAEHRLLAIGAETRSLQVLPEQRTWWIKRLTQTEPN